MKFRRGNAFIGLVSISLAATVCRTAAAVGLPSEQADTSRRYVIIVANNHSVDPAVADLRYADDDGVAYLRHLAPYAAKARLLSVLDAETQARYPGAAARAEPPTLAAVLSALAEVNARIDEDHAAGRPAELMFIFVGHGGLDEEARGFLHLYDQRFTRADLFTHVVAGSKADFTHVIIDACQAFSLVAGRGSSGSDPSPPLERQAVLERFLAGHDLEAYPSVGVMVATSEDRETHEWSRIKSGVFSHAVRSALSGAADVNGDGRLEYSEVAAYVDAAGAGLADREQRVSAFSWPPARDRHRPLLDLRQGVGQRIVVLGQDISGHLMIESESGERWADLHKGLGHPMLIAVPAGETFFARDEAYEEEISSQAPSIFYLDEQPSAPYAVALRGAVDRAYARRLFAVPFTESYYYGFVSGRRELVSVVATTERFVVPAATRESPSSLQLELGYVAGPCILRHGSLENAALMRGAVVIDEHWLATATAELGYAALGGTIGEHAWRTAVMPGITYTWRVGGLLVLLGGIEAGYGALGLRTGGTDASVPTARVRVAASVGLNARMSLALAAGAATYLVTTETGERAYWRPEGSVSLGFSP